MFPVSGAPPGCGRNALGSSLGAAWQAWRNELALLRYGWDDIGNQTAWAFFGDKQTAAHASLW